LKEEPINRSFNQTDAKPATSVSEGVLLNSFQNIEKKKRVFEGLSMVERLIESPSKKEFLSLHARRPVPFNRIQKAMWLWLPKGNSKRLWN
jgi:hypothetical protein